MPLLVRVPTKVKHSAFSVAYESADDAILAAEAVALLERRVLRQPEPGSGGVTERAAGVLPSIASAAQLRFMAATTVQPLPEHLFKAAVRAVSLRA